MALIDEIRSRRGDPDDPFDQEAAKREFSTDRKRRAKTEGAGYKQAYSQGRKEGRQRAEQRRSSKRRPARRTLRRQARQVVQPVRAQVGSGLHFFGLTLVVTAMYLLLSTEAQKPAAVSGLFNATSDAIKWLASPAHSIPAKH